MLFNFHTYITYLFKLGHRVDAAPHTFTSPSGPADVFAGDKRAFFSRACSCAPCFVIARYLAAYIAMPRCALCTIYTRKTLVNTHR